MSRQTSASGSLPRSLLLATGVLTLGSMALLIAPFVPLGVPGEWTWAKRSWAEIDPLTVVLGLLLGAGYWGVATWGEGRIWRATTLPRVALAGWCLLVFFWLFGLLNLAQEYQGMGRSPSVLYYQRTEGYFHQAAFEVNDSREFLHNYRDSIGSGDDPDRYLHLGTHPPGLTLGYRGLLALFEWSPRFAEALIAVEPPAIREAFTALRLFPTPRGQLLSIPEEATLWAATLLTLAAAATACWPIGRLATRMGGPVVGWRAAVLWPLVPSLLVFFPKSDLFCPLIGTASCWLWLDGWSRLRWGRCVLAGVGFFAGLMLTLALAPIALLLVVQTILERWIRRDEFSDRRVIADVGAVGAAVLGFAMPWIAVSSWGHCNLLAIWVQNLQNHAMFYDHNSRNYSAWLVVNPIEGAAALGLPMACLMSIGLVRSIRERGQLRVGFSQSMAWFSVWAFLWLSGKNMGEAARLWIFLAPWPVMSAALAMTPKLHTTAQSLPLPTVSPEWVSRSAWGVLLAMQFAACWWTVCCVDGFHFADLLLK